MGESWISLVTKQANLLEDSIFSRKITNKHHQIPAQKSASSLFEGASTLLALCKSKFVIWLEEKAIKTGSLEKLF